MIEKSLYVKSYNQCDQTNNLSVSLTNFSNLLNFTRLLKLLWLWKHSSLFFKKIWHVRISNSQALSIHCWTWLMNVKSSLVSPSSSSSSSLAILLVEDSRKRDLDLFIIKVQLLRLKDQAQGDMEHFN